MRISRIYIDSILNELHRISDGVTLNYIKNVLRLGIKDRATLFNGNGEEAIYEILEISHKYANLKKINDMKKQAIPKRKVFLYPCLTKPKSMDFIFQKCTEIGVTGFQPVKSSYSYKSMGDKNYSAKLLHWNKVSISACEQSGRHWLPQIKPPINLDEIPPIKEKNFIYLHPDAEQNINKIIGLDLSELHLLIGPEGGLNTSEITQLNQIGWQGYRLDMPILRAETAAVVASTIATL
jgi:16S rRNA (uracil1498-N3)-methyltransferase